MEHWEGAARFSNESRKGTRWQRRWHWLLLNPQNRLWFPKGMSGNFAFIDSQCWGNLAQCFHKVFKYCSSLLEAWIQLLSPARGSGSGTSECIWSFDFGGDDLSVPISAAIHQGLSRSVQGHCHLQMPKTGKLQMTHPPSHVEQSYDILAGFPNCRDLASGRNKLTSFPLQLCSALRENKRKIHSLLIQGEP